MSLHAGANDVDGFLARVIMYSLRKWYLAGQPYSSGCPHNHENINSTNWTQQGYFLKKESDEGGSVKSYQKKWEVKVIKILWEREKKLG